MLLGFNKQKQDIEYPDMLLVTKHVLHSDEVPHPTLSSCSSILNPEDIKTDMKERRTRTENILMNRN